MNGINYKWTMKGYMNGKCDIFYEFESVKGLFTLKNIGLNRGQFLEVLRQFKDNDITKPKLLKAIKFYIK
jgi:hypothetical protein